MKKNIQKSFPAGRNAGFTLIELLVVVLIIGILAAIALPQYTKAVEKSRAVQALSVLKTFAQVYESYYMANGSDPTSFDQLDIDMKDWQGKEQVYTAALDTISNGDWSLQLVKSGNTRAIYIGRLTGEYKGGGFGYFLGSDASFEKGTILCIERTSMGIVFEKNEGDYCRKLFHASEAVVNGGIRVYRMP